ncbi:MAG: hypothetical protein ACRCT8_06470 [Lacipirellulaceae bacterium]
MKRTLAFVLSASLLAIGPAASPTHAAVVGGAVTGGDSGGAFELLVAPAAAGPNVFQSPNLIAFDELQDVTLTEPLMIGPGLLFGTGSVLSSHYVVFDPAQPATLDGTVLFDEPIVALLVGTPPPMNPVLPLFGLPATTYTFGSAMGIEPPDTATIAIMNPARLLVRLSAASPGDHIRVLTGTVVPEPSAAVLGLLALAPMLKTRRA